MTTIDLIRTAQRPWLFYLGPNHSMMINDYIKRILQPTPLYNMSHICVV